MSYSVCINYEDMVSAYEKYCRWRHLPDEKVVIHDLYVYVDLAIYGGRLPIVKYVATETWESGKSSDSEKQG